MNMKENLLRRAIEIAKNAREHGNHPFGALLADENGNILLEAENTVETDSDCTGHAETNLMRMASKAYPPETLQKTTLYTSTEPCPMCFTAIHWSHIKKIVFGTTTKDSAKFGFNELKISDKHLASHQKKKIAIKEGFMREECLELFKEWKKAKGKKY